MRKLVSIVLAATCIAFSCFKGFAQDVDVNQGIDLYKKAAEAYEAKQFDDAIKLGNDAYKIAVDGGEEGAELKKNLETLIPQLNYGKAANLISESKFDDAIKALEETKAVAEKYNSEDVKNSVKEIYPKLYMAMGKNAYDTNDFDAAITALTKAAELDPNNPPIYMMQGASYLKKNDLDNAEKAFLKCAEVAKAANDENTVNSANGPLSTIYLMKAQEAMKVKKWNDMLIAADKSLSYAESVNGYKMKGGAAAQLKKWDSVIEAYDKIVQLGTSKDKPAAYYNLAAAYQSKNNAAKACEFYKKLTTDATYKAHAEQAINALKCK